MTTVLLIAIVVLLVALLALQLTGWPGRAEKEIRETGRELRRELAQQRADSVQLLHAMRIELDESLRETLEQKLDAVAALNGRSFNRRKKQVPPQAQNPYQQAEEQVEDCDEENDHSSRRNGHSIRSAVDGRQLLLFSGVPEQLKPQTVEPAYSVASISFDIDDIPDIEDLPDMED
jgi:FtsZ-interacting cell division protein ZipA